MYNGRATPASFAGRLDAGGEVVNHSRSRWFSVDAISEYLVSHIVDVYFAYGLAFFVFGVSLLFAGRRESSFRFASVLL
ncbi:MAG: hypothetical protein ACK2UI_16875, partial [Anaerolineae bacterium]